MQQLTKNTPRSAPEFIALSIQAICGTLIQAKITARPDIVRQKLVAGAPLIGIFTGSPGHPAHKNDAPVVAEFIKAIWQAGALPQLHYYPSICDGIAQGHSGMSFSLLSRETGAMAILAIIMGHGLGGMLAIAGCDKSPVSLLAAAMAADQMRNGFYATIIPAPVMPERLLDPKLVAELTARTENPHWRQKIIELGQVGQKCNTIAMWQPIIEHLKAEKAPAQLLEKLAQTLQTDSCPDGGICPFTGTGNTGRMVLSALGLVPAGWELLPNYPAVTPVVVELITAIDSAHKERSVLSLVTANWEGSKRVWATIGGSSNWVLHFKYLAEHFDLSPKLPADFPRLLAIDPLKNRSFYTLMQCYQRSSVIDTLQQALANLNSQWSPSGNTVSGPWAQRLSSAPAPDGNFIAANTDRLPHDGGCTLWQGNFAHELLIKSAQVNFDQLLSPASYTTLVYESEDQLCQDLLDPEILWRKAATHTAMQPDKLKAVGRILLVLRGMGAAAIGMPESYYPSEYLNSRPEAAGKIVLLGDGRLSGASHGICFTHLLPEAICGGNISALKDGDLVIIDWPEKAINLRLAGQAPSYEQLAESRSDEIGATVNRLKEQQAALPKLVRNYLQNTYNHKK